MEQLLVWMGVTALVLAIFVPYFISHRRQLFATAERRKEAHELGIHKPKAQFPMIDRSKCIGCGSCVLACPEGDVIGVVWGTAEVINGMRCIGHGFCEKVCPVGALKVGMGDITSRPDIPILSPVNETTVPGMFIAGELGGLSLIRNAIAQGNMVVEEITKRKGASTRSDEPAVHKVQTGSSELNTALTNIKNDLSKNKITTKGDILDVIIVGAGPAGLSAALTAIKNELSYIVVDEKQVGGTILHYPRQKVVMTQPVEIPLFGWLTKPEYSKEVLMETWEALVGQFNMQVVTGTGVQSVRKSDGMFEVATTSKSYYSRQVVLAMGRRGTPRKLECPGEELPKVMYQLVDARSYTDKHMLVVGGGDSAVEAVVGLARQSGNVVSVSYRKSAFFRVKKKNEDAINKLLASKSILPFFDSEVVEVLPESVLLKTKDGVIEIPNDFIIVQIGGTPPFEMLRGMGIQFGGDQKPISSLTAV